MVWTATRQCVCERISELFFRTSSKCLVYGITGICLHTMSSLQHTVITSIDILSSCLLSYQFMSYCSAVHTLARSATAKQFAVSFAFCVMLQFKLFSMFRDNLQCAEINQNCE